MAGYTWEEIAKWIIAGILIIVGLYLLYIQFIPGASGMFWEKINNATGIFKIGKDKLDYEFEIPESMENNVEAVKETISNLLKSKEKVSKEELKLKGFEKCELTFESSSDGNLRIVVKTGIGQLKYYKIETEQPYKPCIVMFSNKFLTEVEFDDEFKKNNMMYPSTIKIIEISSMLHIKALFEDGLSEDFILEKDSENLYRLDIYRIDDDICFAGYYD